MSTILDSLKKSSDQRNNSDKGSLDRFNFGNGKESSSSFSKVIIVLFIALLLAGSFWVYQNYFASDADDSSSVEATSEQIFDGNKDKTSTESEKLILSNKASKKEKPDSEAIKSQIKKIKEHQEEVLREAHLSDLNRNNSTFVKKSEEDIYDKIKSQRSLNKKNQHKMDKANPKVNQKSEKKEPLVKQSVQNEVAQKPTTPAKQYRLLYQLPFAVRKEIPEIKLNIHVYDEAPENRIAIINGTRFAIDDMITDQILLKDILVNGILLDFNGNEFFVPN
jgi:uncharacterized protein YdiU (UPF0061 family)